MLSERQEIERAFHNKWARQVDLESLLVNESFEAVTAVENRCALQFLQPLDHKVLLDLGCGAGETSVYLALQGAEVTAVDISEDMLSVAQQLAARWGTKIVTNNTPAERLPFAAETFDCVFGNGVLHHVELIPTLEEIQRVLKPGGRAVFIEPLCYNPVIEVYRHLAKTVRTPTERPFSFRHLNEMKARFSKVEHHEFWLSTLSVFLYLFLIEHHNPAKVRYWKKVIEDADRLKWLFMPLKRLDDFVLQYMPVLGYLCWNTVIMLEK